MIMFSPRIMVIKMSKMAHEGKKLVTLWAKYLRTPEKSYFQLFQTIVRLTGFGVTILEILRVEMSKNC